MSSSIGSVGNMSMFRMNRPDPSQMASKLFSKLDSSNQGYIEKSDLQSALSQISGTSSATSSSSSSSSSSTSSVDDMFAKLDTDGDGKVTKDEFTSSLKKLSDELDSQFNNMRMNGFGGQQEGGGMAAAGGMPPPPPPGGGQGGSDSGFTKDQLTSQLSDIGSSDSKRSSLISDVVNNFDTADSDGDGKVTFKEAMAYEQSTNGTSGTSSSSASSSSSSSGSDSSSSNSNASSLTSDAQLMKTIMQLAQAYGAFGQNQQANFSSLLSTAV